VRVETYLCLSALKHIEPRAAERRATILALIQAGTELPPITVAFDAHGRPLLRDGNHRLWAARRLGLPQIRAILDGNRPCIERLIGPLKNARILWRD
jgi:hypothetical protein